MVEIDQLPNILPIGFVFFFFFKVDPVFVFIKPIKIGSFFFFLGLNVPRKGRIEIPVVGRCLTNLQQERVEGLGDDRCAADVIKVS